MPTYRSSTPRRIAVERRDHFGRVEKVVMAEDYGVDNTWELSVQHPRGEVFCERLANKTRHEATVRASELLELYHGQFVADRMRGERPPLVLRHGSMSLGGDAGVMQGSVSLNAPYQSRLRDAKGKPI